MIVVFFSVPKVKSPAEKTTTKKISTTTIKVKKIEPPKQPRKKAPPPQPTKVTTHINTAPTQPTPTSTQHVQESVDVKVAPARIPQSQPDKAVKSVKVVKETDVEDSIDGAIFYFFFFRYFEGN